MRHVLLVTAGWLTVASLPVFSSAPGACVTNGADHEYFFVAESRDGAREVSHLAPGETLCSGATADTGGVVSVFESDDNLEGCSRLVADGTAETLIRYSDFDRCHWSSHDN